MEFFIVYVILLLVSFGNFCFFGLFTVCFLLQLQNLLRAGNPSTLAEDLFDIFRVDYFPFQQYLSQRIVALRMFFQNTFGSFVLFIDNGLYFLVDHPSCFLAVRFSETPVLST